MSAASPSFESAFGPLAHHFFPDGCPVAVMTSSAGENPSNLSLSEMQERVHVRGVWPTTTSRAPVPSSAALESIANLKRYAVLNGLKGSEMVAVGYVASVALLPARTEAKPGVSAAPLGPVQLRSALQNGTTDHFCNLVQCMIPRIRPNDNQDEKEQSSQALRLVLRRLVSTCCSPPSRSGLSAKEVAKARCCVLQFWHLVDRWTLRPFSLSSEQQQQQHHLLLATLFQWALHPLTSVDALRVLWHCSQGNSSPGSGGSSSHSCIKWPVMPLYRAQQLQAMLDRFQDDGERMSTDVAISQGSTIIQALTDVLERYDETLQLLLPCNYPAKRSWLDFPNKHWEQDFKREAELPSSDSMNMDMDTSSDNRRARDAVVPAWPQSKRSRLLPPKTSLDIDRLASLVRDTFDPPGGDRNSALVAVEAICRTWDVAASASELLDDVYAQYIHSVYLCSNATGFGDGAKQDNGATTIAVALQRFNSSLKQRLPEQWFQASRLKKGATIDESKRLGLLQSMRDFGYAANSLPVEAEAFFLQNLLPEWSGESETEFGQALLSIVPLMRPPARRQSLQDLIRSGQKRDGVGVVFAALEQKYANGSDRLRYSIVTGPLIDLVYRWGLLLDVPPATGGLQAAEQMDEPGTNWLSQLVREICIWTDNLLLKEFGGLSQETEMQGVELLNVAAIEFYEALGDLLAQQTPNSSLQLVLPSPSIVSRFLLSSLAVNLDRACKLLLQFYIIAHKRKDKRHNFWPTEAGTDIVYHVVVQKGKDNNQEKEVQTGADNAASLAQIDEFTKSVHDVVLTLWSRLQLGSLSGDSRDEVGRPSHLLCKGLRSSTIQRLQTALSSSTLEPSLATAVNIVHGTAFASYAQDFLRTHHPEALDSGDRMKQYTFPSAMKWKYLDYLKSRGFSGVHDLLLAFADVLNVDDAATDNDNDWHVSLLATQPDPEPCLD